MRKVKCQLCEKTDTPRSEMEFELIGKAKPVRKYYHKGCYPVFLEEKAFKAKESEEKDALVESIQKIFGVKVISPQAYPLIEALRNGQRVFGTRQNITRRYKDGYPYPLIQATFEYCEDTIHYWMQRKDFAGFMQAFKYSLTIVLDKIYVVEQKQREQKSRDAISKRREIAKEDENEGYITGKTNKDDDMDISDLLA